MKKFNGTDYDGLLPLAYNALNSQQLDGKTFNEIQNLFGKIATGSYIGTGTYGQNHPTVINCGFKPKIVLFYMDKQVVCNPTLASGGSDFLYGIWYIGWIENIKNSYSSNTGGRWTLEIVYTQTEQGLSYYVKMFGGESVPTASYQNNVNGYTYLWLAIG